MNFEKDEQVFVLEHVSEPGKGLSYKEGIYTLLEDGFSGGWDVYDCLDPEGNETSIYGFSIHHKILSIGDMFRYSEHDRYEYEIREKDLGRRIDEDMSFVQKIDIGKRVFAKDHASIMAMENETQREERLERQIPAKIVRFFPNSKSYTIDPRTNLYAAKRHCDDPESSSRTATSKAGKARTRKHGSWFDGFYRL